MLLNRNISNDMEHDLTTLERPVPWDGSFLPLPLQLSQPSQPPDTATVTSFFCARCRAFGTSCKRQWLLEFREKTYIFRRLRKRFGFDSLEGSLDPFILYLEWDDFYKSYGAGCHLCSAIFQAFLNPKGMSLKDIESWSGRCVLLHIYFTDDDSSVMVIPAAHVGGSTRKGSGILLFNRGELQLFS